MKNREKSESRVKGEQNKRSQKEHPAYARSNVHFANRETEENRNGGGEILIRLGKRSTETPPFWEGVTGLSQGCLCQGCPSPFVPSPFCFPLFSLFFSFFFSREGNINGLPSRTTMLRCRSSLSRCYEVKNER